VRSWSSARARHFSLLQQHPDPYWGSPFLLFDGYQAVSPPLCLRVVGKKNFLPFLIRNSSNHLFVFILPLLTQCFCVFYSNLRKIVNVLYKILRETTEYCWLSKIPIAICAPVLILFKLYFVFSNVSTLCILPPWRWSHNWSIHARCHCVYELNFNVLVCICVISGLHREINDNCSLLGYYAAISDNFSPTFRENLLVPSSGVKNKQNL
jgi:hypothetical protein